MYIYICIYIYIYIDIHIHIQIHIHIHIHTYIYICWLFLCVFTSACIFKLNYIVQLYNTCYIHIQGTSYICIYIIIHVYIVMIIRYKYILFYYIIFYFTWHIYAWLSLWMHMCMYIWLCLLVCMTLNENVACALRADWRRMDEPQECGAICRLGASHQLQSRHTPPSHSVGKCPVCPHHQTKKGNTISNTYVLK